MKSLKKLQPAGKKIIIRLDFDVPVKNKIVADSFRLEVAEETLKYLRTAQKIYLIGHYGKPASKVVDSLRLRPQVKFLAQKLGLVLEERPCEFFNRRYILGEKIEVLENLRFFSGEEKNDKKFAEHYAKLAEVFVFEAFAVSHRKHASVYWLPRILPSFLGLRAEKEIKVLSNLKSRAHETVVLVGGAKAEDKADIIKNYQAKKILLGGETANEMWLRKNKIKNKNLFFPVDGVMENGVCKDYEEMTKKEVEQVRDLGPKTISLYKKIIFEEAKNIVFSGPMGQFEKKQFSQGTKELYKSAIESGKDRILLGGDSAFAAQKFNLVDQFSYTSVGGGASLNYLATGKTELPNINKI